MYTVRSTYKVSNSSASLLTEKLLEETAKKNLNANINEMLLKDGKDDVEMERELIIYQDITGNYEFTMIAREV